MSLVSVILPTYNRATLLAEAIASVLRQTHQGWELLVIDDGSTDNTREVLRGVRNRRLRVIEIPHCGNPARLRNVALNEAAGQWIAFLDSDDLWMPRKLERQLATLNENPSCAWSYTSFSRIDAQGHEITPRIPITGPPDSGWILHLLIPIRVAVATPTVMAAASLVRDVGGFDESLPHCEDYDLWFRLASASPVTALSEPLAKVRSHSSHQADRRAVHHSWIRVYSKYESRAPAEIRGLARREMAAHFAWLAHDARRALAYFEALKYVGQSLWLAPLSAVTWSALMKPIVQPIFQRMRR